MPDDPGDDASPDADEGGTPDSSQQPRQRIDPAEYQKRVDRVSELLSSMIDTATEQATRRCPYKNRHDQCTAEFGCRNQRRPASEDALMDCASDDRLDYRSAWETT